MSDVSALDAVARDHPEFRRLALTMAAALTFDADMDAASRRLMDARQAPRTSRATSYVEQYIPHLALDVQIGPGVSVSIPVLDLASALSVVAAQEAGEHAAAANIAEELDLADIGYRVLAATAYHNAGNHDRVIALSDGVGNVDDRTMLLLILRAAAFQAQSHQDAARETLREALKSKAREPGLRHMALLQRAEVYLAQGRKAQARKDLERILAEDASVEGVTSLLSSIDS